MSRMPAAALLSLACVFIASAQRGPATGHDSARAGMGQVRLFSERVNLAELAEWLDVNADKTSEGQPVEAGARRTFRTPFPGPAVLHLKSAPTSR